jgi:cytosine/adenosine deaminase-related metal-dependent hydrolase
VTETNSELGISDPRDRDVSSMSIESALAAHNKYHGSCNGRLHCWMAAGTPRGSPASAHKAIGDACHEHDIGLTMHCAEAPKDLEIYREYYQCTPAEFCQDNNLTGRKSVLAHMVNLDLERDLSILQRTGTTVAHNPSSNCKLASGIAAVPEMLAQGVNVGLGTDGSPCSNTYDMIREMHLASILHKGNTHDASVVCAEDVLEMATINGARALGLEDSIGSLEVGKKGDFVVVDPSGLYCAPYDADQIVRGGMDPVTTLVYSCTGSDVDMVLVDGEVLVNGGKLLTLDEETVKTRSREVIARLRERAGITSKPRASWKYL